MQSFINVKMILSYCNCVLKSENSETSEIIYISRIIHTVSRDSESLIFAANLMTESSKNL